MWWIVECCVASRRISKIAISAFRSLAAGYHLRHSFHFSKYPLGPRVLSLCMLTKRWCSLPHLATISKKYGKISLSKKLQVTWPWCHFCDDCLLKCQGQGLGTTSEEVGICLPRLVQKALGSYKQGRTISHKWTLHVNWWIYNKQ